MTLQLLTNASVNGDGPVIMTTQTDVFRRNPLSIYITGTFGGATVTISASPDGLTWVPVTGASFTAPVEYNLDVTAVAIKATVSGATGTTLISAKGMNDNPSSNVAPITQGAVNNITVSSVGPSSAILAWTVPTLGTSPWTYKVEKSLDAGTTWSTSSSSATSPFTLSGLQTSTFYWVRITPTSAVGNAAGPGPGLLTTFTTTTGVAVAVAPSVPQNLSVSSITSSGATVSWSNPASGSSPITFSVKTSVNGGSSYATVSSNATSPFVLTGFSASQSVIVQIVATNSAGSSNVAGTFTTASAGVAPAAVTGITFSSITSSGATVAWTNSGSGTAPITYLVETSIDGGVTYTPQNTNATSPQALTSLPASTSVSVRVTASNAYGSTAAVSSFNTAAAAVTYTPSLAFNDARNSQYFLLLAA